VAPILPSFRPYRTMGTVTAVVLPSFRPYRTRRTVTAVVLPSFRPCGTRGENGGAHSTELWPLTGLFVTGAVPSV